jgi:hypothetical protein
MLKGIRVEGLNFLSDLLISHSEGKVTKIYTQTLEI